MDATQNEVVLSKLRKGPLTAYEALQHYGISRLAARVCDLRAMGYEIRSQRVEAPSRYGVAKVASYSLVEDKTPSNGTHFESAADANHATGAQR